MDMKLELLILPVSDVDRAKRFYEKLGFRLDIDYVKEEFRGVKPKMRTITRIMISATPPADTSSI